MTSSAPLAIVTPPDAAAWDALAQAADGSTAFHSSAWARLWVDEWRDARWEAVVVPDAHGYAAGLGFIARSGLLGRRIHAMPYGTYGGPLVRRGHPDADGVRRRLLEAYAQAAHGRGVLASELTWRTGPEAVPPLALAVEASFTHVRPLAGDFDALLRGLPHSVRKCVRQATAAGLTVERVTTPAGVRDYHALAVRTVRRRGARSQPVTLYQRVFESLVPSDLARFHLVRRSGTPISGSLHLLGHGECMNWLTVSDEQHWRLRPNHLLLATVLRELSAEGIREYDFGSSPPDAAGLIRFKHTWGATRREVTKLRYRSLFHRLLPR